MDRRQLVKNIAVAATLVGSPRRLFAQSIPQPNILAVYCSGGFDSTMVFDSKIGIDTVAQEPGAVVASNGGITHVHHASRPSVASFFANYGAKCAIINGLSQGALHYPEVWRHSMTSVPEGQTRSIDWLTYYAAVLGPEMLFPHLVIDAPSIPGDSFAAITSLKSNEVANYLNAIPDTGSLNKDVSDAIHALVIEAGNNHLAARAPGSIDEAKLLALQKLASNEPYLTEKLQEAHQALPVLPNDSEFTRNAKIALDFMARGYTKTATLRFGKHLEWDTHESHYARQSPLFESLFKDLGRVLAHAASNGTAQNLLVVLFSDFGRAPQLNELLGKGRWQFNSMMLWGLGIRGGSIIGSTDQHLRGIPVNPLFGTADGANDVLLEPRHVINALLLKYGFAYERFSNYAPLSPLIG